MVAIFVAFMFVSLVLTDLVIEKWRTARVAHAAEARHSAIEFTVQGLGELCHVPEGVHLAGQHTWVKSDPKGGLEIGADALIARAVGAVARVILPQVGEEVKAGQTLFRLQHQDCTIAIPATLTGRVTAVNAELEQRPELLSSDPYGEGWVCYLTPTRVEKSAAAMRFDEQAAMWLEGEFARFSEFVFGQLSPDIALGVTSQDGGIPAVGCLGELGPSAWSAFEKSFLRRG